MKNLCFFKTSLLAGLLFISFISFGQDFKTKWENHSGNSTFTVDIPINPDVNLSYNYDVDWGDGTIDQNVTTSISHTYQSPANSSYNVSISGTFPAIFMKNSTTKKNLVDILEWGSSIPWQSMSFAFSGCENIALINSVDVPDLSNVEDMSYMFHNCTNMNRYVNNWNVSNINNMRGLFSGAKRFTGALDKWDVNNVIDMTSMFEGAISFDRELPWSTESLKEMSYMFAGAERFNQDLNSLYVSEVRNFSGVFQNAKLFNKALDWELGEVYTMHNMFSGALSFDQDLSNWNTSSVFDMSHMFENAISFDQDLGNWEISNIIYMDYMLSGSNLSSCNYEATLDGWSTSAPNDVVLGSDGLVYFDQTGRNALLGNNFEIKGDIENSIDECGLNSNICGVGRSTFFILEWDLSLPDANSVVNRTIEIPTNNLAFNYDIDWENDGVFDIIGATGNVSHTYSGNNNVFEVAIRENATNGSFPTIQFWNSDYRTKVSSIIQWGCIEWQSFSRSFEGCTNLKYGATDAPDLSANTNFSMSRMFAYANNFNGDLSNWDVTNVTVMHGMFEGASSFDGDITTWNVTNVNTIARMFLGASVFNQNISGWNITSLITSLNSTFSHANAFNQDISSWDVSNVTDFSHTFHNNWVFNQDLDNWNVGSATNMFAMFYGATLFNNNNQPLTWDQDVSQVTNMGHMFRATSFNQDIDAWNVSSVTSMTHMFAFNVDFDQPLDSWDVSSVVNFYRMFYGSTSFDQPLNSWTINTTNPVNMYGMFQGTSSFDQPLNGWDVSEVTTMGEMFAGSAFNQPLNNWDVGAVTNMYRMFFYSLFDQNIGMWDLSSISTPVGTSGSMILMLNNCQMSRSNYESTLIGWDNASTTPSTSIELGAGGRQYCSSASVTARTNLTANWTITGDAFNCNPAPPPSNGNQNPDEKLEESFFIENGNGSFRLRIPSEDLDEIIIKSVSLFNLNGQLIFERDGSNLNHSTDGLSDGVYLVRIETNKGFETQKISINN